MRFELIFEKGGLEASMRFLDFDAARCRAEFPDAPALRTALQNHGCAPGCLDDFALDKVHAILSQVAAEGALGLLEDIAGIKIAHGIPAQPDQVEGLVFFKPYLTSPDDIAPLKARLLKEEWPSLEKGAKADCIVEKGGKVLEYLSIQAGKPGLGVRGEALQADASEKPLPQAGNSILAQPQRWTALKKGFLVLEDDVLKIWGPKGEKSDPVLVEADKMSARLILRKEDFGDFPPTLDYLRESVAAKKFAASVPDAKLEQPLREFVAEGKEQDCLLVKGRPCTQGQDGHQELLVDPEPIIPDADQAGKVDFKEFSFFRTVRKGEVLARIHPNVDGELGMDIFGEPILSQPTFPFLLPPGKNTTKVEVRGGINVVAVKDGRLSIAEGVPEVTDTLAVDDVSLKTGNIDFPGSVEIKGDLRDNMKIKAHGDVEIAGGVEDGCITSDGAIVVRGGFTGSGKGVIKSKLSSVTIGHIRNQRIESHSNILVYNEVINAILYARVSIVMKTLDHSVIGGHLKAYTSIEIANAGNPGGMKTILEVGKDFEVERELEEKNALWKSMTAEIEFLGKISPKLRALGKSGAKTAPEMRLLEQRTKGILPFMGKSQDVLKEEMRLLEQSLYNPEGCVISVRGTAYPGTVLKYKDRTIILSEISKGKRWLFGPNPAAARIAALKAT
ncbi:MAG: FapA family protein [Fibrobacteria bacterium]